MKYNIINVIDLECTCWNKSETQGLSEIIEIGISELEVSTGNILSSESIYVYPEYSKISKFCFNLTGITQEILDKLGINFYQACKILLNKYNSKQRVWASYGEYDKKMFEKQCYPTKIESPLYPLGAKHINVKTLFALKYKLQDEVGMAEALKIANIPLEGRHHSGKDDAKNIAKLLMEILK